jgi:hypothetical protein
MRRLPTAVGLAFLVTVLGVGLNTSIAVAAQPQIERFEDSADFVIDDLCSFSIDVSEHVEGVHKIFVNQQGDVIRETFHVAFQGTWTSEASGKSLIEQETLNQTFDPANETLTVLGLNWHFKLPSGRTVVIDAGRLIFDAEGNIIFEAGKHQVEDTHLQIVCSLLE